MKSRSGWRAGWSNSIHLRATGIHTPSTAIHSRAIAADIRATRSYIRATAAASREIGIYSQEIASYIREIASEWWPCASTSQEMAVNIEEIAGDTRRNAAAAVRPLPAAGFRPIQAETTQLGQRIKSNATGSLNQLHPLRLERGEGRGEVSKIFQPLIGADER